MKKIEIETSLLESDIRQFEDGVGNMKSTIDQTYQDVKHLDSTWEGEAKTAFDEQFQLDYDRMIEICTEIEKYIEQLRTAKKNYENAEETASGLVAAMKI